MDVDIIICIYKWLSLCTSFPGLFTTDIMKYKIGQSSCCQYCSTKREVTFNKCTSEASRIRYQGENLNDKRSIGKVISDQWHLSLSLLSLLTLSKKLWPSLSPDLLLFVSVCLQSSKSSGANFVQLVASSTLWLKANFIVSLGSVRMWSKYHITHQGYIKCWPKR